MTISALTKYKSVKEKYEQAFVAQIKVVMKDSTVKYTQVSAVESRRRLNEGSSIAVWTLAFESDSDAAAAQTTVASEKFTQNVASASGVQVKTTRAELKEVEVQIEVDEERYELVEDDEKSDTDSDGKGKGADGKDISTTTPLILSYSNRINISSTTLIWFVITNIFAMIIFSTQ